jgi:hypothetical protein
MLAKIKNWGLFLWMKQQKEEAKRQKDLKEVAKQEELWDMKLRGLR